MYVYDKVGGGGVGKGVGEGCTFRVMGRKKDGVGRGVILGLGLVA